MDQFPFQLKATMKSPYNDNYFWITSTSLIEIIFIKVKYSDIISKVVDDIIREIA